MGLFLHPYVAYEWVTKHFRSVGHLEFEKSRNFHAPRGPPTDPSCLRPTPNSLRFFWNSFKHRVEWGLPSSQLWYRRWADLDVFGASWIENPQVPIWFHMFLRSGVFQTLCLVYCFLVGFFFCLVWVLGGWGWGGAWGGPPHSTLPFLFLFLGGFLLFSFILEGLGWGRARKGPNLLGPSLSSFSVSCWLLEGLGWAPTTPNLPLCFFCVCLVFLFVSLLLGLLLGLQEGHHMQFSLCIIWFGFHIDFIATILGKSFLYFPFRNHYVYFLYWLTLQNPLCCILFIRFQVYCSLKITVGCCFLLVRIFLLLVVCYFCYYTCYCC